VTPVDRSIGRQTRLDIFDSLRIRELKWYGDVEDATFLDRIWDLSKLPSTDNRFPDAAGDIWQHRVNNPDDWEDDWIYTDPRFDLLDCADDVFLRFCETLVHPAVRRDPRACETLVGMLDDALERNGWRLVPGNRIAGQPIYSATRAGGTAVVAVVEPELHELVTDPVLFEQHVHRMEAGLRDDPPAAIGSAKELVETTCRVILVAEGVQHSTRDDVLDLYKKVAKTLRLNAEAVPEDAKGSRAAQGALRNLSAAVQNLAELRNAIGTGHGRSVRPAALERHARLSVGAATAVCRFLLDTWHDRRERP
jgi:hypothetical protein